MERALKVQPVLPPASICHAIERAEAESAYSQHVHAPQEMTRKLGLEAAPRGTGFQVVTRKSTNVMYNRTIGLGQGRPATREQIARAIEFARGGRAKVLGIPLGGRARPAAVAAWLREMDFKEGLPSAKLWRDGSPLRRSRQPTTSRRRPSVRRVRPREAAIWVDVVGRVWRTFRSRRAWFEARVAQPNWYHFVALVDGEPAGAGALYVSRQEKETVGHLVEGVTLGEYRRLGVQSAVIRKRISVGLGLGCTAFTSETAPPLPRMPLVSFRNLRRQGFELAYLRPSWSRSLE